VPDGLESTSVSYIQDEIASECGIPVSQQHATYDPTEPGPSKSDREDAPWETNKCSESSSLSDCDIEDKTTLVLKVYEVYVYCPPPDDATAKTIFILEGFDGTDVPALQAKIASACGIPPNEQIITFDETTPGPSKDSPEPTPWETSTCGSSDDLDDCGIPDRSTFILAATDSPTSAPTMADMEPGVWVVDRVNDPSGGTKKYFEVNFATGNANTFNGGATACNFISGTSGQEKKPTSCLCLMQEIATWTGTHGTSISIPAQQITHLEGDDPDAFVDCDINTIKKPVTMNGLGIEDLDTLVLWPWTYCPTDTYRWGSRLACDSNPVAWNGEYVQKDMSNGEYRDYPALDYGPYLWIDNLKGGCRGWCLGLPQGDPTYPGFENDVDKCDVSKAYTNPNGLSICTMTGGSGSIYSERYTSTFAGPNPIYPNLLADNGWPLDGKGTTGTNGPWQFCSGRTTWQEAKDFCTERGARLCTKEELELSCAERTGCDYDYVTIWAQDECTITGGPKNGQKGHYVAPGDQRKWHWRLLKNKFGEGNNYGCGMGLPASGDPFFANSQASVQSPPNYVTVAFGTRPSDGAELSDIWYMEAGTRYPYYSCDSYDTSALTGLPYNNLGASSTPADATAANERKATTYGKASAEGVRYGAMFYDLLGQYIGDGTVPLSAPATGDLYDEYGQFCMPDDVTVFTRCCADYGGSFCRTCPNGKSRPAGAEDFDITYVNVAGNAFPIGDGVEDWGSQYDSCV
jgi:hypothetical protein